MTDFLGNCVKDSCGLLDSGSSGGGTTLTANNKLLGVGDKQIGTTDNTNLQFYSNNKIRAILDNNGNFDVRDLRTSEVDILPNQQFKVVSGTATLSNFESTITTTSESDEFKTASEFTPDNAPDNSFSEDVYIKFDNSTTNLNFGVIDTLGNITLCASSPLTIASGDVLNLYLFKTPTPPGQVFVSGGLNGVSINGVQLTTNLDLTHNFYYTGYNGTATITRSKVNNTEQKGSINLVDNHNYGLAIREDGKDYLTVDTLNDSMVLSNLTDINSGSIAFNDNEILITKEIIGSQEAIIPNETVVNQSTSCSLSGEVLSISVDESSNITIPLSPAFVLGDSFSISLNIDKVTSTSSPYYFIGIGEYSTPPLNYLQTPVNVYPTNAYYSSTTGFGSVFGTVTNWSVNPNFQAPNYNAIGVYEIKLVLEENGQFKCYIDDVVKFSLTLVGNNTFECFVHKPTQGSIAFDTSHASMLSDGGVIIDGYPVAVTFDKLLGIDPEGNTQFKRIVLDEGLIIGDEDAVTAPYQDKIIFSGNGQITANNVLELKSGVVVDDVKMETINNYHITTDRSDIGRYVGNSYTQRGGVWDTVFNGTISDSTYTQTGSSSRAISQSYNLSTAHDFEFEILDLAPHRHWIGFSDSNVNSNLLNPTNQAFWFKISVADPIEGNFYRAYTGPSTFVDETIGTGITYAVGTKIKFEVNTSNEVRLYLDTGSGYSLVSTAVYTVPESDFYARITDGSGPAGAAEIDLQVTAEVPDITDKIDSLNFYSGHNIHIENDFKISHLGTDDYMEFDVFNNHIETLKELQPLGNINMVTNDITNIGLLSLPGTRYVTTTDQLGVLNGTDRVLEDGISYVICGNITVEKNIRYGVACSIRGLDFQANITFDETLQDCQFISDNEDFYLSNITINEGGGRFSVGSSVGLINATNYNVGSPAPFYGRSKRFRLADCNIIRPYKVGQVIGYGTLNINSNFINGGGGSSGEVAPFYTVDGISVSDGLSLEFNNNKMVLFQGAQITPSTGVMLRMLTDADNVLGFNAVTITGNIFHPRESEKGIEFEVGSSTALGNITGNTFIRTGGVAPLIDYPDQVLYDNYNPAEIVNYTISANAGITQSEPNLKTIMTGSTSTTSATYALIEPLDNSDILPIAESSRFAIQLDLTGVVGGVSFKPNERILDVASSSTALIVAVDPLVGTDQTVYITDMSNAFSATPTSFIGSVTGSATGGSLRGIYYYFEKDPRRLTVHGSFEVTTGNNETYFLTHGSEVLADDDQESYALSDNAGAGASLSIVGSKLFNFGDKLAFWVNTISPSSTTIDKMVISVK